MPKASGARGSFTLRVVVSRTDAIGDTLLTMPMAKMIKEKHPGAQVIFLVSPRSKELFKNHAYIDDYWVMDPKWFFYKKLAYIIRKFREFKPTTYIYVGGSHIPSFAAWLKRIPIRGGLKSKWQSFIFLNKGKRQSRSLVTMHESDYNLSLLNPLGMNYDFRDRHRYRPSINLTLDEVESSLKTFNESLREAGIDPSKELFFIHPGMTGHTLNWPSRNYGRLISRIEERFPGRFTFVVSHTPADEKFLLGMRDHLEQTSQKNLEKSVFFFNGAKKGLRHYMSVLSKASFFVGPSTGTTHIANTLGVKQVCLYSPIKVQSSMRWGPFNRNKACHVLVPEVVCGETFSCAGDACPYYECMSKIEVDDVKSAIEEMSL